jgi:curved DNA-binding protein CbpA
MFARDHYALLRLERTATTEEVRKAFRVRSKETHPDLCAAESDPEVCGQAAQEAVARNVHRQSARRCVCAFLG